MGSVKPTIVIGAGIVGVSAAIWLRRAGREVLLLDRGEPGMGTSYGNACILANSSVVPVTVPGLIVKGPKYALDPNFPLFLRWGYMPRMLPWLARYLSHANDKDTRRISKGLVPIVGDGVDQHKALTAGTDVADFVTDSTYSFAYADRAAFDADKYGWDLRAEAGFVPEVIEGDAVREFEPAMGAGINLLAVMRDHGVITEPGAYVAALTEEFQKLGGTFKRAEIRDFEMADGKVTAVVAAGETLPCADVVLTTGAWSKPLMKKLGLDIPLETERGYHIVYENPEDGPRSPIMIASGKFVATPMAQGLRCAGIVEFGGLDAGPSKAPLALLRKEVRKAFPRLKASNEVEWQGHRPATTDSLPLIGEVGKTGVFAGFGHHHIGLTGGPKTGRLIAQMMTGQSPNLDMSPYDPQRYAR